MEPELEEYTERPVDVGHQAPAEVVHRLEWELCPLSLPVHGHMAQSPWWLETGHGKSRGCSGAERPALACSPVAMLQECSPWSCLRNQQSVWPEA